MSTFRAPEFQAAPHQHSCWVNTEFLLCHMDGQINHWCIFFMTGNVPLLPRIKTTHFTLHERWCWSSLFNWDSILVTIPERRLAEWPSFSHHVGPSVIKRQTRNQRPKLLKRRVLTPQQQAGLRWSAGEKFIRFFSLSLCYSNWNFTSHLD